MSWPCTTPPECVSPWPDDFPPTTPPYIPPTEPPPPPNRSIYPLQTRAGYAITVTPYNPSWPEQFATIKSHLYHTFTTSTPPAPYAQIEHIGSTAIPNLAAKPNIDILVTFPSHTALTQGIDALDWETPSSPPFIRYTRVPNGGGIQGRESFKLYVPHWSAHYHSTPERSVYLINEGAENSAGRVQIRCYRDLRDTLRDPANHDLHREYGDLKIELGQRIYEDSITYSALKNDVVRKILRRAGWSDHEVDEKEKLSERGLEPREPAY